jgi:NAD(P)H-hydrate epimerase
MKIFTSEQIRKIDQATIAGESISSADLMERAANQLLRWHLKSFDRSRRVVIFTGPGNNGGDGLALARMLSLNRYNSEVYHLNFSEKTSDDWMINYKRLTSETTVHFTNISSAQQFPVITQSDIVVDSIFGSGLTRPAEGLAAEIIRLINQTDGTVVSVDIPSGMSGEDNPGNNSDSIIMADYTLSFQLPKLSFMFAENLKFTGEWILLPIGLNNKAIRETDTPYTYLTSDLIPSMIRKREKFDHKGMYGHGLLVAGSYGKMGAAILGAKAAMRTGMGLITCHIPRSGNQILQSAFPEAMICSDTNAEIISEIRDIESFDAIGIGPGIGTDPVTQKALHSVLLNRTRPMVIDADGLNILGLNHKWLSVLPHNTILTPHLKEFERIAGKSENGYKRLEKQIEFAARYGCVVILKGACTSIVTPSGKVFFNSTGNPGMATAGSGDVLTGILLSLLAQGYTSENAALTGVYLHGLAGDIASGKTGQESIIASDIIDNLGYAFLKIKEQE